MPLPLTSVCGAITACWSSQDLRAAGWQSSTPASRTSSLRYRIKRKPSAVTMARCKTASTTARGRGGLRGSVARGGAGRPTITAISLAGPARHDRAADNVRSRAYILARRCVHSAELQGSYLNTDQVDRGHRRRRRILEEADRMTDVRVLRPFCDWRRCACVRS